MTGLLLIAAIVSLVYVLYDAIYRNGDLVINKIKKYLKDS